MQALTAEDLEKGLEDGYLLAAIPTQEYADGLRICAVVRSNPDPAAGYFVFLRDMPQARVFLGCIADAKGAIHDWLELWIQNTDVQDLTDPAYRNRLTNLTWDAAWSDLGAVLREIDSTALVATSLEEGHLPPAILNPETGNFEALVLPASGHPLVLCRDDRLLDAAGLPAYGSSLARYLYAPDLVDTAEAKFVRIRADAPANEHTIDLESILPPRIDLPTLSLAGSGLIARKFMPLTLEEFSEVAGGAPWRGIDNARRAFHVPGVYRLMEDVDLMRHGSAHLFTSAGGLSARLAEALYLKLEVFSQACRLVRRYVRAQQKPLLNVSGESFRVRLGATGLGLPFLWTARVELTRPGQAFALPLGNTGAPCFRSLAPLMGSIYRPGFVGIAQEGVAHNLRLRRVFAPVEGGIVVEGTLRTASRLTRDGNDLLTLRLPLAAGTVELYGHIDVTQELSRGEVVFRTVPQTFPDPLVNALRTQEGVPYNDIEFTIQAPLSTPFDLYSLGVLALRLLVVGEHNPLAEALDAAFSLANQVREMHEEGESLDLRVERLFASDARWHDRLGFQHLLSDAGPEFIQRAELPEQLWREVLTLVLRFFPGVLPESFCKGYGDAPRLALETVFDAPIQELDSLLLRYRAFLFGGWRQNLEIVRLIDAVRQQL